MTKLMPINNCERCRYIRIISYFSQDENKNKFVTICEHPTIIKIDVMGRDILESEYEETESYEFPEWCPLDNMEKEHGLIT